MLGPLVALLLTQGLLVKSTAATDVLKVDANGNVQFVPGVSAQKTYIAQLGAQSTATSYALTLEAGPNNGFQLLKVCWSSPQNTNTSTGSVIIQRRLGISTSGTLCGSNFTSGSVSTIAPMELSDGDFPGICRFNATNATAGAILGIWSWQTGEVSGGGTADPPGPAFYCHDWTAGGGKGPIIQAGAGSGVSLTVQATGTLSDGTLSVTFVSLEN